MNGYRSSQSGTGLQLTFDLTNVGGSDVKVVAVAISVPGLTLVSSGGSMSSLGLESGVQPFPVDIRARGGKAPVSLVFDVDSCLDVTAIRLAPLHVSAEIAGKPVATTVEIGSMFSQLEVGLSGQPCGTTTPAEFSAR